MAEKFFKITNNYYFYSYPTLIFKFMEIIRKLNQYAIISFIENHDIRMIFLSDFRDSSMKILVFAKK